MLVLELGSKLVLVQVHSIQVLELVLGSKLVLEPELGSIQVLEHKLELHRSKLVQVHSNHSLPCGIRTIQLRWSVRK